MTSPCPAVSIVMPCLDEAAALPRALLRARLGLAALGIPGEIIVADNGSSDASVELALSAGARVVRVSERGYGSAVRGGLAVARGEIAVMGDADGSYDFAELPALLRPLVADEADLVLGCRLGGVIERGAMPWAHRHVGTPFLTWLTNRLYGLRLSDTQSGLRAFRTATARALDLRTAGMELASEMLVKASRAGLRVAEVPIRYGRDRRDRRPHLRPLRDGWRHVRLLLLFGPRWLFAAPAAAALSTGLLLAALAATGTSVGGHALSYHVAIVGGAFVLLGTNVAGFGAWARTWSALHGLRPREGSIVLPRPWRRAFAPALTLALAGCAVCAVVGAQWVGSGGGPLDAGQTTALAIGTTAVLAAVQVAVWALALELSNAPERSPSTGDRPVATERVSVIVVCREEEESIGACLDSLLAQDGSALGEIVVVDGVSSDATRARIRERMIRDARVRMIDNPDGRIASGRLRGVAAARNPWILFLDADCRAAPGWVQGLATDYARLRAAEPRLAAVGGGNMVPRDAPPFARAVGIARTTFWGHRGSVHGRTFPGPALVDHLPTVNVLYDRAAVLAAGSFDPAWGNCGEDVDLAIRVAARGHVFAWVPGRDVEHRLTRGPRDWAAKMFRYGNARARLLRAHGRAGGGPVFLVPAGLVACAAALPIAIAWPWAATPTALYVALTAVASAVACVRARRPAMVPLVFLAYALTHLPYGAGIAVGLVGRRRHESADAAGDAHDRAAQSV